MKTIKCTTVGDGATGKTCMLISYTTGKFPRDYVPTIFDTYAVEIMVNNENFLVELFDTAGQEEYDRLRLLAYPDTNVFLICYDVVEPDTFENIKEKWLPEVRHNCPDKPFVLVGTKIDLRFDTEVLRKLQARNLAPVTSQAGQELARKLKAASHVECSALTRVNKSSTQTLVLLSTSNISLISHRKDWTGSLPKQSKPL